MLFVDPLTVKELSGIARRWQTYAGRTLYVGLIGLIVWGVWASILEGRNNLGASEFADLSRGLFYSFFALQLVVVSISGITASSDLVTKEVRSGTLGLLALTPLTPWTIALGKWKAALLQSATAILCGVPVLAICVYLKGIGLRELAYSSSLSLASAAVSAALGLLGSTIFRTGNVATIVTVLALCGSALLPMIVLIGAGSRATEEFFTVMAWIHPYYAAIGAPVASAARGGSVAELRHCWIGASLLSLLYVAAPLVIAARRIGVLIRQSSGPSVLARVLEKVDRASGPSKDRVWEHNAILWKELKTRPMGRFRNVVRIALALFLLVLVPFSCTVGGSNRGWLIPLLWFSAFTVLLICISNGASLFVREKEERKWDILLTTPLRAHQIVLAKLIAGVSSLLPVAILLFLIWSVTAATYRVGVLAWLMTLGAVGFPCVLAYSLAGFNSLRARSMQAAFSTSFGIMIALLIVLPSLLGLALALTRYSGRDFEFIIACISPAPVMATFSASYSWRQDGGDYVREAYEKLQVPFLVFTSLYLGLSGILLMRMIFGFDRIAGRSRQA